MKLSDLKLIFLDFYLLCGKDVLGKTELVLSFSTVERIRREIDGGKKYDGGRFS